MHSRHLLLLLFILLLRTFSTTAQSNASYHHPAALGVSQRVAVATPEHQALMNKYDVTFYKLDLQLERNSIYIAGHVTIEAQVKAADFNTFAFELHPDFQIDSVVINGVKQLNLNRNNSDVSVILSDAFASSDKISAVIYYKGTAPSGASAAIGNGFNTATEPNWGNQVTWSLSEPYAAYEWWPTKQVLTDKADSVYVFVTTSDENKVGSNGLLTQTVALPNNKIRYEWKSQYPIAYYLISVAVSDYEEYLVYANPEGAAPIPVLNYVYRGGALTLYKEEIDVTAPLIEHFSDLFILYPFAAEKYGHSMAPIGGGMEHQTMTTQSTFTFTLTAHELAHQWFGDYATCATWSDIWLNEGFASYGEYLALQQFRPAQANNWMQEAHQYALQRTSGSLFVADTMNVSRLFDFRLSYKKGAAVVHMLRYTVNNDALFFEALRNYLHKFGGKTVTTADLQQVFEETTNLELDYFFDQWYKGEGAPVFNVEWNQKGPGFMLVSEQTPSGSTAFFKTDVTYRISTTTGDTTIRVPHNQPTEQYQLQLTSPVTNVEIDPDNWLLNYTFRAQATKNPDLPIPDTGKIILYPNPAHNIVKLTNLSFTPNTVKIFDSTGRLVKQQPYPQATSTINIQELPDGFYILQVSNGNQYFKESFIKIR